MLRVIATLLLVAVGNCAHAWGNKGHEVIAHIAWHYLQPSTRAQIDHILQGDSSGLTTTDFIDESTWADAYRDSDRATTRMRYEQTRRWHYINLAIAHPDFAHACFGSIPLRRRQNATDGPAEACIVDKIDQFAAELSASTTTPQERLLALQFLIHLVGDLHQPLHASNNDDGGGNDVRVSVKGYKRGTLHGYWDNGVLSQLGRKPEAIARKLIGQIDPNQLKAWRRGTPSDWALDTFALARNGVYKNLPPPDSSGTHTLDINFTSQAKSQASQQLTKAGVRLAWLLEKSLAAR